MNNQKIKNFTYNFKNKFYDFYYWSLYLGNEKIGIFNRDEVFDIMEKISDEYCYKIKFNLYGRKYPEI